MSYIIFLPLHKLTPLVSEKQRTPSISEFNIPINLPTTTIVVNVSMWGHHTHDPLPSDPQLGIA